jgi:hypothetical protein
LALGLCRTAWAGVDRWTPFGPGEGVLQSLVASTRGELYVTTHFAGGEIWQRPTAAAIWRWRGSGLALPQSPGVTALAIHPKNPNALWAVATGGGGTVLQSVFRSTDAGASWRKVFTGDLDFQVVQLTVAPTAHSVALFAETGRGTPRRLLRSADVGVSWTPVPGVLGPVAAAPDEPGTVYAVAASGSGVVKSGDGGKSFDAAGALPIEAGDEIRALHATHGRQAVVFASLATAGLFRSANGGGSWRRIGFVGSGPSAITSEPGDPKKIYPIHFSGLYASDRSGLGGSFRTLASFAPGLPGPGPTALVAAPGGPYFLIANDLYRFTPPRGFAPVAKTGVEAFGTAELRTSSADPSFMAIRRYTGCIRDSCNFRTLLSKDGGATFQRLGAQITPGTFADTLDLAFDPADPRRRLILLGAGFVLLRDSEANEIGRNVYSGPVRTVEIAANGTLLIGGFDGIHRSANDGAAWTPVLDAPIAPSPEHPEGGSREIVGLVANPYAPDRVIAGALEFYSALPHDPGASVLYRSADAGATWTKLRDGGGDVEFIPGAPESFYLLFGTETGTELRRSDDFGTTSTLIHTFPVSDAAGDVATDPSGSGDLYLASRLGVRRSRDGGATWEPTAGGFNPFGPYRGWIGQIQVTPDGRLIASPLDGGLFENRLSD